MPVFKWTPSAGATYYRLWVTNPNGVMFKQWYSAAASGCESTIEFCSIVSPVNITGKFKWRIKAYNILGTGIWSDPVAVNDNLPKLVATPGNIRLQESSSPATISIVNTGSADATITNEGTLSSVFDLSNNSCTTGAALAPTASCSVTIFWDFTTTTDTTEQLITEYASDNGEFTSSVETTVELILGQPDIRTSGPGLYVVPGLFEPTDVINTGLSDATITAISANSHPQIFSVDSTDCLGAVVSPYPANPCQIIVSLLIQSSPVNDSIEITYGGTNGFIGKTIMEFYHDPNPQE